MKLRKNIVCDVEYWNMFSSLKKKDLAEGSVAEQGWESRAQMEGLPSQGTEF